MRFVRIDEKRWIDLRARLVSARAREHMFMREILRGVCAENEEWEFRREAAAHYDRFVHDTE